MVSERLTVSVTQKKKAEKWRLHLNEQGIDVSVNGWDSEMVEYPFVFKHKKEVYMLYNGDQFGKTGFGIARRETKSNLPK